MLKSYTRACLYMRTFISFNEALSEVLDRVRLVEAERIPLSEALGRTLAKDVVSSDSIPPFASSAMDGYALRAEDLTGTGGTLKVIEHIPAGRMPQKTVGVGQCARIMTGAPIPKGADTVVPVEWTQEDQEVVDIDRGATLGVHVRPAAEDVCVGDIILREGDVVTPGGLGMLASLGCISPLVRKRPRIGIISTGDEVVPPSAQPEMGQIRNSNGPTLQALAGVFGASCMGYVHAKDDPKDIQRAIESQMETDLLIIAGGVSVGQHDYVKTVLEKMGMAMHFWKVRQRPGKPLAFGTIGKLPILGLPGNPVSSAMCFSIYGRRAIDTMLGKANLGGAQLQATMNAPMKKVPELHYFSRGIALMRSDGTLEVGPAGAQGSNLLGSVLKANCIIHLPADQSKVGPGTKVTIELLPWTNLNPV